MSEETGKQLISSGAKERAAYSTKEFQLDVLGQLAELQAATQELREALAGESKRNEEVAKNQEQSRLLRFDGRTLVAIGAIALSLTGYVLQDARNTTKRDAEIESATAKIANMERVEAANTEGRIKTDVELGELREGQAEIKTLLQEHDSASRKTLGPKSAGRQGQP